jgi:ParB-like nuclease family protein
MPRSKVSGNGQQKPEPDLVKLVLDRFFQPTQPTHPDSNGQGVQQGELDQVQVRSLGSITPSPENDNVYGAVLTEDPEVVELANSIEKYGVQEPLLISRDGYIISGHRRFVAASLAGLEEVPVRFSTVSRTDDPDAFLKLLVELNSQRVKSTSVLLHESMIKIDPKEAHQQIINDRIKKDERRGRSSLSAIDPEDDGDRCVISSAKGPFLDAVRRVLEEQYSYWPLSDRQIHYRLLGPDAPLTHASKPGSRYRNDKSSYRKLTDLLARGRIAGLIPWEAIEDVTRPVDLHSAYWSTAEFFREQFDRFLKGYWRNRQQSQPHHIEIVAEKLTVQTILQRVAQKYTIPLTISRGMSSLPPKKAIEERLLESEKDLLILLVVSDLDPAGDAIAADLVKSFRRDFSLDIEAYKVALTIEQVTEFGLAPSMEAKDTSPTYQIFVDTYGVTDAYELEAMDPADLARTLEIAIKDVLDIDLYNQELAAEEADSRRIIAVQKQATKFFKSLNVTEGKT